MLTTHQIGGIIERALEGRSHHIDFDLDLDGKLLGARLELPGLIPYCNARVRFDLLDGGQPEIGFVFDSEKNYAVRDLVYITCLVENIADRIDDEITEADYDDYKKRMREYE